MKSFPGRNLGTAPTKTDLKWPNGAKHDNVLISLTPASILSAFAFSSGRCPGMRNVTLSGSFISPSLLGLPNLLNANEMWGCRKTGKRFAVG